VTLTTTIFFERDWLDSQDFPFTGCAEVIYHLCSVQICGLTLLMPLVDRQTLSSAVYLVLALAVIKPENIVKLLGTLPLTYFGPAPEFADSITCAGHNLHLSSGSAFSCSTNESFEPPAPTYSNCADDTSQDTEGGHCK